jgi:hypothetical protein
MAPRGEVAPPAAFWMLVALSIIKD